MEYTIVKLARLSGLSTRTLRYYDEIGLLRPARLKQNGYRVYGQQQVDRLQQILFYRELGVRLEEIGKLIGAKDFDRQQALCSHLAELNREKARLEKLIDNVTRTISAMKGETTMTDRDKFEGFKREQIEENEKKYGVELRQRYGDEEVNASNVKLAGMSEGDWQRMQELEKEIAELLRAAVETGDPACAEAQKACELHKQWLCMTWKKGAYSKQAHRAMGEMYVSDERFSAYYDAIAPGCAAFFNDALAIYCK